MVREARETAAMGHTAFVPVFDAGVAEDGCAYIEMARLEGRDLYTIRTEDGPLLPDGCGCARAGTTARPPRR